jgi:hypothetical protein
MFGDVAVQRLKLMGRSNTMPSAFYAEDVQAALDRLKATLNAVLTTNAPRPGSLRRGERESVGLGYALDSRIRALYWPDGTYHERFAPLLRPDSDPIGD